MRILLLSDLHSRGGAAVAAGRLKQALAEAGHTVGWAAAQVDHFGPDTFQYDDGPLPGYVARQVARRFVPAMATKLQRQQRVQRITQIIEKFAPDIISVHNLHFADLPPELPATLSKRWPVVWTMHDMWAFTGGCSHAHDCPQFTDQCGADCPYHEEYPKQDPQRVAGAFRQRQRGFANAGRLGFVSPSKWLAGEASQSMIRDMPIEVIPHGVDLTVYRPVDRAAARAALGLPMDRPVIMTAVPLNNPQKGIRYLGEALFACDGPDIACGTLSSISRRQILWLSAGRGDPPDLPGYVEHIPLEHVGDERLLALAYNAADVHVLPTLVDNLPNVLIEAAACGTPSVAFDRGGVSEAVVRDETGWVTPVGDVAALAKAINACLKLSDDQKRHWRTRCRAYAAQHWNLKLHAHRYQRCFEQAVGESPLREAA